MLRSNAWAFIELMSDLEPVNPLFFRARLDMLLITGIQLMCTLFWSFKCKPRENLSGTRKGEINPPLPFWGLDEVQPPQVAICFQKGTHTSARKVGK